MRRSELGGNGRRESIGKREGKKGRQRVGREGSGESRDGRGEGRERKG